MNIAQKTLAAFAGATLLVAAPVAAAPVERASQSAEDANQMGGGTGLIFIVAAVAVAILAVVAFDKDGNDNPVSP